MDLSFSYPQIYTSIKAKHCKVEPLEEQVVFGISKDIIKSHKKYMDIELENSSKSFFERSSYSQGALGCIEF